MQPLEEDRSSSDEVVKPGQLPWTFPFGASVEPCLARDTGRKEVFVLGPCPGAMYVRWIMPGQESGLAGEEPAGPKRSAREGVVNPMPVDNEPWPFWDGRDEAQRVKEWEAKHFRSEWGKVEPGGHVNGLTGRWLQAAVFEPLGIARADAWLTTCLDRFGVSPSMVGVLSAFYGPLVAGSAVPRYRLPELPGENSIMKGALHGHRERLTRELRTARPEKILTVGNAALGVIRELFDKIGPGDPGKTLRAENYGTWVRAKLGRRSVLWLPLAIPGAQNNMIETHHEWLLRRIR